MKIRSLFSIMALSFGVSSVQAINYSPDNVSAELLLKVPGNDAVHHSLKFEKYKTLSTIISLLVTRNFR